MFAHARAPIGQEQLLRTRTVELAELKRVWEITATDIVMKDRIDGKCSGAYGEVCVGVRGCARVGQREE